MLYNENDRKLKAISKTKGRIKTKSGMLLVGFVAIFILIPVGVYARYNVTCKSVIFSDSTKVKRHYGKGVHNRVLPASTTKVMTALLVLENLPLDKYVSVSHHATKPQPTKIYAKQGEQFKVRDLLYAIMLKSANDGAVVLAEAVAGSESAFVNMMNKRAKELNANHTKFSNPNGLPSKATQYTTAYDMYLIFRAAIKHDFFRELIQTKHKTIYSRDGRKISLKSHNKILYFDWRRKLYGKTGYTHAAKSCFVGTVEHKGSTMIIAVFGCTRRWDDIKHIVTNYSSIKL